MIVTFLAFLIAASLTVSACGRQPIETVPTGTVDTLTFVVGDPSRWPRHGTQFQDQIVDRVRREVCWVKYRDARTFECWRWDDRWIYHEVDHALDGDSTGRLYRFSDGRWLPRRLSGVWTLDLPRNRAIDLSPDCREQSRPFPYRMRAHVDSASDLGGSIGIRSTLVLDNQPVRARSTAAARDGRAVLVRGRGRLARLGEHTRVSEVRRAGRTGHDAREVVRRHRSVVRAAPNSQLRRTKSPLKDCGPVVELRMAARPGCREQSVSVAPRPTGHAPYANAYWVAPSYQGNQYNTVTAGIARARFRARRRRPRA